jgi:hypothetical protein
MTGVSLYKLNIDMGSINIFKMSEADKKQKNKEGCM